ncbi:MAG: hypothetical protein E7591_04645 [Ruminococcaceae bacterium]|nr:hypothetical protein [Oscillospiraceae bacterium]
MRRLLTVILCFLLISLASCTAKNEGNTKQPERKTEAVRVEETTKTQKITEDEQESEPVEKELLTPEILMEELCTYSDFACMLQTPGCNELYNSQITLTEPVVKSYRLSNNYTGEYIQLLCLACEEDAKTASETYNGFDYTNRFGAMYLFGSSSYIDILSFLDYEYPASFESQPSEEPAADSVAGIVKAIEDATELCGGYYSEQLIESTKDNINNKFTLEGDILNLVHLTYHDGTVLRFVYIYEFESENDAALYEADRTAFSQSIEDGVCVRSGNKVIFGNHSIISEIF